MASIIVKRRKKQVLLRNTMLKMQAMQCKIELENGLDTIRVSVDRNWRPPKEEEESPAKQARIEMETQFNINSTSNTIQDLMTDEEEEETEEAKAERVKIEIETTLKAIRDSVTNVKKAEDNNMCLVEALDLSLPLNSNNAQTSTDFGPIEFKSVSDLTLHMANFSLCEIPISNDEFASWMRYQRRARRPKLYPHVTDFLPFVRLPKSAQLRSSPDPLPDSHKNMQQVQTEEESAPAQPNTDQRLKLGPMYIFATPSFANLPPISP